MIWGYLVRIYYEVVNLGETPVRSIERAIDILYCLAEGEQGLAEICSKVSLEKGTVHRQLATLIKKGFAAQNPATGNYTLGQGFYQLIYTILDSQDLLVAVAKQPMEKLNKLSNETVVLDIPKGLYRLCVAEVKSIQGIVFSVGVGSALPIYAGAVGKIIIGFMSESARERFIENVDMVPFTNKTVMDKKKLYKEVKQVAKQEYAITFGERFEGSACISVPIISGNRLIAVLSILGPSFRLTEQDLLGYLPAMQSEARDIARSLGMA